MSITTIIKNAPLFVSAAFLGLLSGTGEEVTAATQVVSSATCFTEGDHAGDYGFLNGVANFSSGLGWRPRRIVCPLEVGASVDHKDVTSILVDGYDGNNENRWQSWVRGKACLQSWAGGAARCSAEQNLTNLTTTGSFTGSMTGAMSHLNAGDPYHYATLQLELPSHGVLGYSQIYGYTLTTAP